jgi:hypothetical protein
MSGNSTCNANAITVLPPNIQCTTYYNKDRDSINTGLFDDYCRRTGGNNHLSPGQEKQRFWQNCSEDDAKTGKMLRRMDPALKCYLNFPNPKAISSASREDRSSFHPKRGAERRGRERSKSSTSPSNRKIRLRGGSILVTFG